MIYVHLATGFEEIEALTPVDLLRRVGVDVQTVSMEEGKVVAGAHGIPVTCDVLFSEADYATCDMIVLPGGMPGTEGLMANETLAGHIKSFMELNRWVAAICAAPMILGSLGVLEGRKAVIYPGMEEELKGAEVPAQKVVVDGHLITSKGPGTAMDFALAIVEAIKGKTCADELREDLVLNG